MPSSTSYQFTPDELDVILEMARKSFDEAPIKKNPISDRHIFYTGFVEGYAMARIQSTP